MIFNLYKTNIKKNLFVTLYCKKYKMNLIIDSGNTIIKAAVFEDDTLVFKQHIVYDDWQNEIKKILKSFNKIDTIVISNVSTIETERFSELESTYKVTYITRDYKFPFTNGYQSPQTLGIDRMVLASGAVLKYPGKNRLVIDAGTCITYDFVDETNTYLGGAISPGIQLRYKSLNNYTANLPLLSKEEPANMIGTTTNESIHSGIVNGVTFEIESFIDAYSERYPNFIIILTGGDADFLAKRLKNTIFANSNFLLESLNQTFQYNQND
jgi:type III pantothenate kinase